MKIKRKHLMIIAASLGAILIIYSLVRHFFKIDVPESLEKYLMDVIIIAALGIFMYNRKLFRDEKRAKEAERRASEEPEEYAGEDDENIPHWERHKKTQDMALDDEPSMDVSEDASIDSPTDSSSDD